MAFDCYFKNWILFPGCLRSDLFNTPIKLPKDISQNMFDIHYSFNNTIYVINQKSTFDLSWTYE